MADSRFTLTIRLIKSFEHRNIRYLVLKDVDPACKVADLKKYILEQIKTSSIPPPFKHHDYDSLKINSYAHGAKTNDTAIVLENDEEWILRDTNTLLESNIKNETELSFYKQEEYEKYKLNPQLLW